MQMHEGCLYDSKTIQSFVDSMSHDLSSAVGKIDQEKLNFYQKLGKAEKSTGYPK